MTKLQKAGLILLILGTLATIKVVFFSNNPELIVDDKQTVPDEIAKKQQPQQNENVPKSYVNIYFIGKNSQKEEVYKVIKRPYNAQKDGTKLNYSIKSLLNGPSNEESTKGIYSEIPCV